MKNSDFGQRMLGTYRHSYIVCGDNLIVCFSKKCLYFMEIGNFILSALGMTLCVCVIVAEICQIFFPFFNLKCLKPYFPFFLFLIILETFKQLLKTQFLPFYIYTSFEDCNRNVSQMKKEFLKKKEKNKREEFRTV